MIIPYSKIANAKVLALRTQTVLGEVADLVIKKNDLSLYGLILKKPSLGVFAKPKAIASLDIIEIGNGLVLVNDSESIIELVEAIRIKKALEEGFCGIEQKVVSKSGKRLGKVYDYLVESPDYRIIKFYVKGTLTERIIPSSAVIKMEGKKIIVQDDFEPVKPGVRAIEAEMA